MNLHIQSTADLNLNELETAAEELRSNTNVVVDHRQIVLSSTDPPSWIQLIAQVDWWMTLLGPFTFSYAYQMGKRAADASCDAMENFASKIWKFWVKVRPSSKPTAYICLGIPFPDEEYSTLLRSTAETKDEFIRGVALFVYHLPALSELMNSSAIDRNSIIGWVSLSILEKGDLQVSFLNSETMKEETHVLKYSK